MKKIISVILSILMLLPLFSMCLTAQAEDIPTVYICGWGTPAIYSADGQQIYKLVNPDSPVSTEPFTPAQTIDWMDYLGLSDGVDMAALITRVKDEISGNEDALTPEEEDTLFVQLLVSFLTESKEAYTQKFCDIIGRVYENFSLDKNGEASDGSGIYTPAVYFGKNKFGGNNIIEYKQVFNCSGGDSITADMVCFDGRVSPLDNAESLREYLLAQGYTRVNFISRCMGCSTVLAYLAKYGKDETVKVEDVIFYVPAFTGVNALTALFTGSVCFDSGAVADFVTYAEETDLISIEDESVANLLKAFLGLADSNEALPLVLDVAEIFIRNYGSVLIPAFLKISYGTCPSMWSMIAPDQYEKAKEFVFSDCTAEEKAEWAGMLAKTDAFHEIQANYQTILKDLAANGVEISVVSKYGIPCMPLSADAHLESDMFQTTNIQSFGATVSDIDKKLPDNTGTVNKYASADGKIDASTCLFPDTTWFIKNCSHKIFPDCINELFYQILNNDGFTVESNSGFTQYLDYTHISGQNDDAKGTLTPIVKAEDTNDTTQTYDKSTLTKLKDIFISLITKFVNWVIGIFAGIKE